MGKPQKSAKQVPYGGAPPSGGADPPMAPVAAGGASYLPVTGGDPYLPAIPYCPRAGEGRRHVGVDSVRSNRF